MELTSEEQSMLDGEQGEAARQSMEILAALGKIFKAERMVPVTSVQVAGVSYDNLGEAGLEYLEELVKNGARVLVKTTLNPAGMDLENYKALGITDEFAGKQKRVISAFIKMGIEPSCTCTPYYAGNLPNAGEHIAWSESSAVCFANSVLGAYTNREGGPSALAAAITGRTPMYGMHLEKNRQAKVQAVVECQLAGTHEFGALGKVAGEMLGNKIPLFAGIKKASGEELKSLSASIATYGGTAMFHMGGITKNRTAIPSETVSIARAEIDQALQSMNDGQSVPELVSIGCPHLSSAELNRVSQLLEGKKVKIETWICVSRKVKGDASNAQAVAAIEAAGAKFACDTCMVVAPIKGRFGCIATDSAKSCFYSRSKNNSKTRVGSIEECIACAIEGEWEK